MNRWLAGFSLIAAALLLVVPLPAQVVEQVYSSSRYPTWARAVVPLTGAMPFAVLDLLLALFLLAAVVAAVRGFRRRPASSTVVRLGAALYGVAVVTSLIYLWFLAAWGLNYQRVPLKARLDYDRARVSPMTARDLATRLVAELNRLHPVAWSQRWPELAELPARLAASRDAAAAALRIPPGVDGGVPKRSLLQPYFRWAGIDGVTDPFLPEILVNAELLPTERAFVVAHEWGHLAGLAHEAEASFAGWRICLAADDQARYSAWLSLYGPVMAALPVAARSEVARALTEGPRRDLRAIAARYQQTVPAVRTAAWSAYDRYLRSNRVAEGIASYDAVVELMLGVR